MTLHPVTGTIRAESPRAKDWKRVFGGDTVPLLSPIPERAHAPDGSIRQFYRVNVATLPSEILGRVVDHVAAKWGLSSSMVWADLLGDHGLPILAEDVAVAFDARLL